MGRNFELETRVYSEQDFKDSCWLNYTMGFFSGVVVIVLSELTFAWYKGWIL